MRGGVLAAGLALMASSALAAPAARLTLRPTAKGVVATYALEKPVSRFVFAERAEAVRDDTWRPPAGMTLKGGVLKRRDGKRFSSFSVTITPDTAPRDRTYPGLTRIGDGWQIYGPYFAGEKTRAPSAAVAAPKGWTVLPRAAGGRSALEGYVYVGPSNLVTRGAATVITAPNVAKGLRGQIAKASDGAAAYYARRLGVAPAVRPVLLVTRVPAFSNGWQGDTVPGLMMSLRFFGPGSADTEDAQRIVGFVAHEFFHFWNGGLFHSRDGESDAWLHEGAAEYAALLASHALGGRTDADLDAALSDRLTGCASALKAKGLEKDPPKMGKPVYDCGVVVQWAADLKLRAASGGKQDVLDAWKEVFNYAKAGDGRYDPNGFLAAAGLTAAADDPLRLLLQPGEPDRWTRLTEALNRLGARVESGRSADADRAALIFGLLGPICRGSYGFVNGDPAIRLDTGDRCDAAKGDPQVDEVAGRPIVADPSGAFDAVAALCATGEGGVPLRFQGQLVATLPCRKLGPPPQAWKVTRWR